MDIGRWVVRERKQERKRERERGRERKRERERERERKRNIYLYILPSFLITNVRYTGTQTQAYICIYINHPSRIRGQDVTEDMKVLHAEPCCSFGGGCQKLAMGGIMP